MSAVLCDKCGAVSDSWGAELYCAACYRALRAEVERLKKVLHGIYVLSRDEVAATGVVPDAAD